MIVDASVLIDAVADPGPRGIAARRALAAAPEAEELRAPGHLPAEVLSGLRAAALRPAHPLLLDEVHRALERVERLEVLVEASPWADVHRAWELARGSLRYSDALYVATAERRREVLVTADARIGRSGAPLTCQVLTVHPAAIDA